ncbi:MAG: metal-dependent hydrolase [Halioglobus sp.]
MPLLSNTPNDVTVEPRNHQYDIASTLATDWFAGHPFKTAWFNAMSMTFPLGEKFFIDSVRHFADQIDDPKLQEEIRGFCGQEGFHRREHQRYNETLCAARGYDLDYLDGRLARNIAFTQKVTSPLQRLAATAAFEHMTAIMAESALADDSQMIDAVDDQMRAMWDWHAAEEMEHKAVAFDVYRAVGGTEKMRKRGMRQATFFLMLDVMVGVVHMLRRDKKLWNLTLWKEGWRFLFGKQDGILRAIYPAYKEYYREGFHPWQRDTRPLLNAWKASHTAPLAA